MNGCCGYAGELVAADRLGEESVATIFIADRERQSLDAERVSVGIEHGAAVMVDLIAVVNPCKSLPDPFDQLLERFNVRPLGCEP